MVDAVVQLPVVVEFVLPVDFTAKATQAEDYLFVDEKRLYPIFEIFVVF